MTRFDGAVVVVTGGASGIGAASARRFATEGATVFIADVDVDAGEACAAGLTADGLLARFVPTDVSDPDAWQRLATRVHDEAGPVSVVHSNAYLHVRAAAGDLDPADWQAQIGVTLSPLYLAVRTFLTDLQHTRGSVVATSSVHAMVGLPGYPAYAAAKGGINALVRQLAVEYGPEVRFNSVLPGPILTQAWSAADEAEIQESVEATALKRMGTPQDVAAAVTFLASADASYITGATLLVDGGWTSKRDSA